MDSLGKVSMDAWISGLGSFLGALIAGILAAIISIAIFKKERKEEAQREIDRQKSANTTIGLIYENITTNLLEFVTTVYMDEKEFEERKRFRIKELHLLVEGINELEVIYPLDVPNESISSFLHSKHLLKILKYELEEIINNEKLDKLQSYKDIIVVDRFLKIIENLIKIYSEGLFNEETLKKLKLEFNELNNFSASQSTVGKEK